jgi:hypothetical protein
VEVHRFEDAALGRRESSSEAINARTVVIVGVVLLAFLLDGYGIAVNSHLVSMLACVLVSRKDRILGGVGPLLQKRLLNWCKREFPNSRGFA